MELSAHCASFSALLENYLQLMKRIAEETNQLLKFTSSDRDRHVTRLFQEFFSAQEALANHRREHRVHDQILEEALLVLPNVVVMFCRDGALVMTRESIVAGLPDRTLANGLLFSSEQWLDVVPLLLTLIERMAAEVMPKS